MVLLKDRLEALGGYLRQWEKESDFGSLRQQQYELIHKSLTEQLVKVTFTEAGQYVQLLQAMPWTDEQRKALLSVVAGEAFEFRAANSSSWETAHARFHSISTVSSRRRLEEDHRCFVSFASLVADSEGNHGAPGALDIESTIRRNVCFADRAFAST